MTVLIAIEEAQISYSLLQLYGNHAVLKQWIYSDCFSMVNYFYHEKKLSSFYDITRYAYSFTQRIFLNHSQINY